MSNHRCPDYDACLTCAKNEERDRIIAWLRDPGAMSAFDGLSECVYTSAVLPEELANALEKASDT